LRMLLVQLRIATDHITGAIRLIGQLMLDCAKFARHPARGPWRDISGHLFHIGTTALPITALVGFLIAGLVLAYLMAQQLRQFGADAFVVNILGIALIRELGPVLAAILIAGRSGYRRHRANWCDAGDGRAGRDACDGHSQRISAGHAQSIGYGTGDATDCHLDHRGGAGRHVGVQTSHAVLNPAYFAQAQTQKAGRSKKAISDTDFCRYRTIGKFGRGRDCLGTWTGQWNLTCTKMLDGAWRERRRAWCIVKVEGEADESAMAR